MRSPMDELVHFTSDDFIAALYEKMKNTPNLVGKYELVGNSIFWQLFENYPIEVARN